MEVWVVQENIVGDGDYIVAVYSNEHEAEKHVKLYESDGIDKMYIERFCVNELVMIEP